MKKWWPAALIVVLVILVITVPSTEDYNQALKNKIKKETENNIWVNLGVDLLGDKLIKTTSSCNSYVVVRTCETKVTDLYKLKSIGFLNQYIFY
ncbi:hypothetical protein D3P09_09520 [Paenibacillus pinisoli]|uniref:DUF4359 domain-containing protein n=1 Tax=Paenibacillus pinisoli TaxID=1276110 RepID=A0A3A6PHB0_9BACL|nr:hypothetical protein [Paenibacillus pinisoli]RJX39640.1 hypothetical protein D3P09_09520 [Paenibacillus pinisoli]